MPYPFDLDPTVPTMPLVPETQDQQNLNQVNRALISDAGTETLNESLNRGNELTNNNQMLLDYNTLDSNDFIRRYGPDAQMSMQALQSRESMRNAQTRFGREQGLGHRATDLATNVAQLAHNTLAGASTFLANAAPLGIGQGYVLDQADRMERINESYERNKSAPLRADDVTSAIRKSLDDQDSTIQYERDIASGKGAVESQARKVGRDIASSFKRIGESEYGVSTLMAEGVGSIIALGPIARSLSLAARSSGLPISTTQSVMLANGMVESGTANNQIVQEVRNKSFDELSKTSEDFRNLIASNMPPEEARDTVALLAGSAAALYSGFAGYATGGISALEAAPFASGSIRNVLSNIGRETVEEAIQSPASQLGQNIATLQHVDDTAMLSDDLGESIAQGIVGGATSAGALQSPSVAGRAIGNIGAPVAAVGRAAVQAADTVLASAANRTKRKNEESSELHEDNIATSMQEAVQNAPVVADAVKTIGEANKELTSFNEEAESFADRVTQATSLRSDELEFLPDSVLNTISQSDTEPTRFDVMRDLSSLVQDENIDPLNSLRAGIALSQLVDNNKKLFVDGLPDFIAQADPDTPEYKLFKDYENIVRAAEEVPAIQDAIKKGRAALDKLQGKTENFTPEEVSIVDTVAKTKPTTLKPDFVKSVLSQEDSGRLGLSTDSISKLRVVDTLNDINASKPKGYVAPDMDIVSRHVRGGTSVKSHQLSLGQHVERIFDAMQTNDRDAARRRLIDLKLFAAHQINKVNAMRKSEELGGGRSTAQKFKSLGDNHRWVQPEFYASQYYINSPKGRKLAETVYQEAADAAILYNKLREEYSDLNPGSSLDLPGTFAFMSTGEKDTPVQKEQKTKQVVQETKSPKQMDLFEEPSIAQVEKDRAIIQDELAEREGKKQRKLQRQQQQEEVIQQEQKEVSEEKVLEAPIEKQEVEDTFQLDTTEDRAAALKEVTNNLPKIKDDKEPFFDKVYQSVRGVKARLYDLEDPIETVKVLLENPTELKGITDKRGIDFSNNIPALDAFSNIVGRADRIKKAVTSNLVEAIKKDPGLRTKLLENKSGRQSFLWTKGKALNILDVSETGFKFNTKLLDGAILAGIDWFMNTSGRFSNLNSEEVKELFGTNFTGTALEDFTETINNGMSVNDAVRDLSRHIENVWGVQGRKNMDIRNTQGISGAVAIEILNAMSNTGFLGIQNVKMDTSGKKTQNRIMFNNAENKLLSDYTVASPAKTFLSTLLNVPRVDNYVSVGSEITDIPRTQLNNPRAYNTRLQREVISKSNKIKFLPNLKYKEFTDALGMENFVRLLVGDISKPEFTNVNTIRSFEGKIGGIVRAFTGMEAHFNELNAYAEANNIPIEDVPTYYATNYTSVSRLQQLGGLTPQSDKHVRHMIMASRVTIDMTKPSEAREGFWLSVAQGLGIKVENKTNQESISEVHELIRNTDLASIINDISDWQSGKTELPQNLVQRFEAVMGVGNTTTHAIDSILSLASLKNAIENGTADNFVHHSFLEADGKTNGPINTLMLFSQGQFNTDWLSLVQRGGFILNKEGASLSSNTDKSDLYTVIADALNASIRKDKSSLGTGILMSKFVNDVMIQDESSDPFVEFGRNFTKNPITIRIYGSGTRGIAYNIADEFITNLYKGQSNYLQAVNEGYEGTFGEFMGFEKGDFELLINPIIPRLANPQALENTSLTLTKNERDALATRILNDVVGHLDNAIRDTIDTHIGNATATMQKATQVQSIFQKHFFKSQIVRKLADKKNNPEQYPEYSDGDFLSLEELDDIFNSLEAFAPIIKNRNQNFDLATRETTDLSGTYEFMGQKVHIPQYVVNGLNDDRLGMLMTLFAPSEAGVRAVPSLVIGSGDGLMQMLFASGTKLKNRFLDVYDGLNMPVDDAFAASREVNEAVFKTWTDNNPFQGLHETFSTFAKMDPIEYVKVHLSQNKEFFDEFVKDMSKVIQNRREPKFKSSLDAMDSFIKDILEDVTEITADISARQKVIAEVPVSIDQMASANSPFSNKGDTTLRGLETDDLIQEMNKRYSDYKKEELNKLKGVNTAETEPGIQAAKKSDIDTINKVSETDPETGAKIIPANRLREFVRESGNNISGLHRDAILSSVESLISQGYSIITGSSSQIKAHMSLNTQWDTPRSIDSLGYTLLDDKKIYLYNPSPETLAHEIIHAATADKVNRFYEDSKSVTKEEGEAIIRLESLMNEWLVDARENLVLNLSETSSVDSLYSAYNQINNSLEKGKSVAVNEFIAWSLTNQNVASQQRTRKVKNPVARIIGDALTALKKLIWGDKTAPNVDSDMFSNIRFNARILSRKPSANEVIKQDLKDTVLYQSYIFGDSERLSNIRNRYIGRASEYITDVEVDPKIKNANAKTDTLKHAENSVKLSLAFTQNGFAWDMQQRSTFTQILGTLMLLGNEKSLSMSKMQSIYDHFLNNVTAQDLQDNPKSTHPADIKIGSDRLNALTGSIEEVFDRKGLSSILPAFLAASQVDPVIQRELGRVGLPTKEKDNSGTVDGFINNLGNNIMDTVGDILSGARGKTNANEAIRDLIEIVSADTTETKSFIENHVNGRIDTFDQGLSDGIGLIGENLVKRTEEMRQSENKIVNAIGTVGGTVGSLADKGKVGKISTETVRKLYSGKVLDPAKELSNEIVGRTADNAKIFDMITPVRGAIHQIRQQWRDIWPQQIHDQFTIPPTKDQWSNLSQVISKTDLVTLIGNSTARRAFDFVLDKKSNNDEIKSLTKELSALPKGKEIVNKSTQLAAFMMTGYAGNDLVRNPFAIATIYSSGSPSEDLINKIDRLVSHKAIEMLKEDEVKTLQDLAKNDIDALETLLYNARVFKDEEFAKISTTEAKMNAYKGFLNSPAKSGYSLIVRSKSEHADLVARGYRLIQDYEGSPSDPFVGRMGYYFTEVSGRPTYNQGVLQTVQQTYSGVDSTSGYTLSTNTAGRITNPRDVAQITRRLRNKDSLKEPLLPVRDGEGNVIAYERSLDPAMMGLLHRNEELNHNLGAWRGRQMEELLARIMNTGLVNNLKEVWDEAKKEKRTGDFEDISSSKDKVIQDSWNVIPQDMKESLIEAFGDDGVMIRKDMIVDAVGVRSASVGDSWTGTTRLSKRNQERIKNALMAVFGNKAYRYAVTAEDFVQGLVTTAKVAIVIKSVKVAYENALSNLYQLTIQRGISPDVIMKEMPKKVQELREYDRGVKQMFELDIMINKAQGARNFNQVRNLEARKKTLYDKFKRLSVWPLIEKGEYSAITEGGVSQDDLSIGNGRFADIIENALDKAPEGIKTIGRYAFMSKDTPVFMTMSKSVQYGDFIAKSIYFDDLTKNKGMTPEAAVARISEEFVNYNRAIGRWRLYSEKTGILWFWNFKLRSIKVAASIARDNPFRAIMGLAMTDIPFIGDIGNPIEDNLISVYQDGRLPFSVGPEMGMKSIDMLPISHLWK